MIFIAELNFLLYQNVGGNIFGCLDLDLTGQDINLTRNDKHTNFYLDCTARNCVWGITKHLSDQMRKPQYPRCRTHL